MSATDDLPYTICRLAYDDRKNRSLWPSGARMAMLFYTCPEEWEWDKRESMAPFATIGLPGEEHPSASTRTAVRYGFEIGLPRIYDIAQRYEIKLTLGTTGNAAKRHASMLRKFAKAGHEIAAHGYSEGMPQSMMSRAEQAEDIDRTLDAIMAATGVRPRGWWGPAAACNDSTVELLAEREMLFHGDLQDDELPYLIHCGGHTLVEIPYNMVTNINDLFMFATGPRQPVQVHVDYLTSTFDAYYEQAGETPLLMIYGTHPYVSGRPEAALALSKLIEHAKRRDDVWIATYSQVAEWWRSQHAGG